MVVCFPGHPGRFGINCFILDMACQPIINGNPKYKYSGPIRNIDDQLAYQFLYICYSLLSAIAFFLPDEWPVKFTNPVYIGTVVAPFAMVLALVLINFTNLRIIHADIVFKMADPYAKTDLWPNATRSI